MPERNENQSFPNNEAAVGDEDQDMFNMDEEVSEKPEGSFGENNSFGDAVGVLSAAKEKKERADGDQKISGLLISRFLATA